MTINANAQDRRVVTALARGSQTETRAGTQAIFQILNI